MTDQPTPAALPLFGEMIIARTLANPRCTPDHVLVLADALDECCTNLPPTWPYAQACRRRAEKLRDLANSFNTPLTSERANDQH